MNSPFIPGAEKSASTGGTTATFEACQGRVKKLKVETHVQYVRGETMVIFANKYLSKPDC